MADGIRDQQADGDNIEKRRRWHSDSCAPLYIYFRFPIQDGHQKCLPIQVIHNIGIEEIWDMIDRYVAFVKENGYFNRKRNEQASTVCMKQLTNISDPTFIRIRRLQHFWSSLRTTCFNLKSSYAAAKEALDKYEHLIK